MASFPPIILAVGTTPIQILPACAKRTQYIIIFVSTSKIAGNTGTVTIGIGSIPALPGAGQNGHVMSPGEQFGELSQYPDFSISKDAIYAIASAASQIIEIYEVV